MRPEKIKSAGAGEFPEALRIYSQRVSRPYELAPDEAPPRILANHTDGQCLFPDGTLPEGSDASRQLFCFAPVEAPGARYCADCARLAFQPSKGKSK